MLRQLLVALISFLFPSLSLINPQSNIVPTTILPSPTIFPISPSPVSPKPKLITKSPTPTIDTTPWGISRQIGEHTWTMKIALDPQMATASEILHALNQYRLQHNSQPLTWDNKLAAYALSRAQFFTKNKNTDSHQGFNDFLQNQDGFRELGYNWLGENASYGYRLNSVHLIEWIYAGDQPHDDNQLNNRWDHIGIGVDGTATCLIFATGKR